MNFDRPATPDEYDAPSEEQLEQQAATELGIQRERAEASNGSGTFTEATEAMIDSVQESSDADAEVEFLHAQGEGEVSEADRLQAEAMRLHVASDDPENDPEVAAAFDAAQAAASAEDEPVEVDFSTLSEEDARSVLFNGLVEMNARLVEQEQKLMLLAQSFVRILEAAGASEEGARPNIEVAQKVPKMATVIKPR